MKLSFVIPGAPRTKKNHSQIVRGKHPRLLPSKQYRDWYKQVQWDAKSNAMRAAGELIRLPLTRQLNARAIFHLDHHTAGDAVGYYQALADLLEGIGIVENDRLIVSWDGSRVVKKSEHPRIDLILEDITCQ